MDTASFAPALDAVNQAKALSGKASAKERALIEALTARYTDRGALDQAYADAMQKVAPSYPEDDQIAVLYAESLMELQPWDYWTAAGTQPKGHTEEMVGLLEKVLTRSPDHPGAIHYYIHLTEASSDPKRAVPHARRLGRLMPGAGHVVHMPFHTFFRVGMYKEAVEANRLAVAADEAYIARSAPVGIYPQGYYPHNVHSLMVSAQMAGDGATVIESADKLGQIVSDAAAKNIAWVQPIKAAPYFAHAQFSDAKTILSLADPGATFPYVQGLWHYARAVGLANAGDVSAAQVEVDAIAKIEQTSDFSNLDAGGVPAREVLRLAQQVDGKVDAFLAFPVQPQELRLRKVGRVILNTTLGRPWSEYFCCMLAANRDFVATNPVATKRALRAILIATDICAREPERVARFLVAKGYESRYEVALDVLKSLPYDRWRQDDPTDTVRFYAIHLHEVGMIKSTPQKLIDQGTDWRFLNELKKELKA